MKEPRWLVPCTGEGNARAVEAVVQQAHVCGATVVAVSLVFHSDQSENFLESVTRSATRAHVHVECHVIVARKGTLSLTTLVHELCCSSIVLVTDASQGVFLSTHEVRDALLGGYPASLVLIRLSEAKGAWLSSLVHSCLSWLHSWHTQREENGRMQNAPPVERECLEHAMTEQHQNGRLM